MINVEEAKNRAGDLFVNKFGKDFIRDNAKRLSLSWSPHKTFVDVFFGMFSRDIDTFNIDDGHGGIINNESEYPQKLMDVRVYLNTGKTEII